MKKFLKIFSIVTGFAWVVYAWFIALVSIGGQGTPGISYAEVFVDPLFFIYLCFPVLWVLGGWKLTKKFTRAVSWLYVLCLFTFLIYPIIFFYIYILSRSIVN